MCLVDVDKVYSTGLVGRARVMGEFDVLVPSDREGLGIYPDGASKSD